MNLLTKLYKKVFQKSEKAKSSNNNSQYILIKLDEGKDPATDLEIYSIESNFNLQNNKIFFQDLLFGNFLEVFLVWLKENDNNSYTVLKKDLEGISESILKKTINDKNDKNNNPDDPLVSVLQYEHEQNNNMGRS